MGMGMGMGMRVGDGGWDGNGDGDGFEDGGIRAVWMSWIQDEWQHRRYAMA